MRTAVTDHLDAHDVPYRVRTHSREALTAELAATERGVRLSQIVKCMVATGSDGQLYALLLPGDRRLKLRRARRGLGGIPLQLADREVLAADLGLTVGAIAPFPLLEHGAKMVCDPSVLDEEWVDISSGDALAGVELRSQDLVRLLDATLVHIVSDTEVAR